ncbi:MAG: hypothetical protein WBM50_24235 [Acidimicrobiales bacterium]
MLPLRAPVSVIRPVESTPHRLDPAAVDPPDEAGRQPTVGAPVTM